MRAFQRTVGRNSPKHRKTHLNPLTTGRSSVHDWLKVVKMVSGLAILSFWLASDTLPSYATQTLFVRTLFACTLFQPAPPAPGDMIRTYHRTT